MKRLEGNSYSNNTGISCYIHRDRTAVGTCVECGKFVCSDCNVELNGKNHCQICVQEIMNEKNRKIEKLRNERDHRRNESASPYIINNNINNNVHGERMVIPRKSKTVAGILGIFFGAIGLQKFYLGKIGQGILCLLFSWTMIPTLIGLIEGFGCLLTTRERFAEKYGVKYLR